MRLYSMEALQDFTALGLLALIIVLASHFGNKLFAVLNAHLQAVQDMDKRQTIILHACADELSIIRKDIAQLAQRERME